MCAYALARLQWRGRNNVLLGVILLVILPFEAIAVPLFYLLNDYRNTYYVQFLPFIANAFSIYLFYTFFVGLPEQIEEAARVDGAGAVEDVLPDHRADVQAGLRVGDDPDVPGLLGRRSCGPVMVVDQPSLRPLPLADLGLPGAAADRLGPDLRLRRDDGSARSSSCSWCSSAGSSRASQRPVSRAERGQSDGNDHVRPRCARSTRTAPRRSRASTWRSPTASSWSSSARPAAASPPRCA